MKIALINENSQAAKNEIIFEKLSAAAKKYGHEVILMATEQNPHMQQTARENNIPIHRSLISVAKYLKDRER